MKSKLYEEIKIGSTRVTFGTKEELINDISKLVNRDMDTRILSNVAGLLVSWHYSSVEIIYDPYRLEYQISETCDNIINFKVSYPDKEFYEEYYYERDFDGPKPCRPKKVLEKVESHINTRWEDFAY